MFARNVSMALKPNGAAEFARTIKNEIIPLLRKQKGFKDEIIFIDPNGMEALGITLRDQKENTAAYYRTIYPLVQEILARAVEATPEVKTYEVTNSTYHRIPTPAAPPRDDVCHRSVRTGRRACPPKCSAQEQRLKSRHRATVRGKLTPQHTIRVIATNLISGTVTVRAESKSEALTEVEQRINP
jgi:hypothetical protein